MITPIQPLSNAIGEVKAQGTSSATGGNPGMFESIFRSTIENVKATDAERVEAEYLLATGQLDNPAMLMIAETKSSIAVDLLVQLRNKAMEAYSELTNINL